MAAYTRKTTVDAVQFLVNSLPWPTGVVAVGSTYAAVYPAQNLSFQIEPGDYIVTKPSGPKVVARADFEDEFQL